MQCSAVHMATEWSEHTDPATGRTPGIHWEDPPAPACNGGIMRIYQDPNIINVISHSYYYSVGGPPKARHSCIGFTV